MFRYRWLVALAAIASTAVVSGAQAAPPSIFDPLVKAQNFSITQERQAIYDTPAYQTQLSVDSAASTAQALATEAGDPGRLSTDDLCWNEANGCAGDIRLNDWAAKGYGLVRPVLFTARDGATISGHVWATVAGPAKRPGIVITNGSVQADEQMYWYLAQTLAKDGYLGGPGPNVGFVPGPPASGTIGEQGCPAHPADRTTVPITKPGLGLSATPNTSLPSLTLKEQESLAYSKAGVDSGEIVIRGARRLQLHPQPGIRGVVARTRRDRLVRERVV